MTNSIAVLIVVVLGGLFAADLLVFGWDIHLVLGRRFVAFLEWLAVWR